MDKRQIVPIVGLVAVYATSVGMVVKLQGQQAGPRDFTNAALAEVRDAQGQTLLQGQFAAAAADDDDADDDDEMERKAILKPTGVDKDAAGEAEVEFSKATPAKQEIEFAGRNLQPGAVLTFWIDGIDIGTATVNPKGGFEVEVNINPAAK
jgi:hypothetical protein